MAVMWEVIINEAVGSEARIHDLGIYIGPGETINFSSQFDYEEIAGSDDLRALVDSGDLRVENPFDTGYLTAPNGVKFLSIEHLYHLEKEYYDKAELQGIGTAEVHWSNIKNAPAFGAVNWGPPIIARVTEIGSEKPIAPVAGDICVDTNTTPDKLFKYNGSTWVDLGDVPDGAKVINLESGTDNISTFDLGGDSWTDEGQSTDNDAVMVNDDGDGNPAQYIYDDTTGAWFKIGDVDFASHFDGTPGKHDATEVDVEGTYPNIPGTPASAETAFSAINTKLGNLTTAVGATTLDGAYDQGGAGAGRLIKTTAGPVKLDRESADSASLQIVPKGNLPTLNTEAGQIDVKDNILCIYDSTRSKWLSVQRQFLVFGRRGKTKNQYLGFFGSRLVSLNSGLRIARDACIVSMSGQLNTPGTCTFNIRRNDIDTNIAFIGISASTGYHDISINADLTNGDFLQCHLGGTAAVDDPMIVIEIAWRL